MPDLGKYALEVSLAYGGSLAALLTLIAVSWRSSKRVKTALDAAEARKDG